MMNMQAKGRCIRGTRCCPSSVCLFYRTPWGPARVIRSLPGQCTDSGLLFRAALWPEWWDQRAGGSLSGLPTVYLCGGGCPDFTWGTEVPTSGNGWGIWIC